MDFSVEHCDAKRFYTIHRKGIAKMKVQRNPNEI